MLRCAVWREIKNTKTAPLKEAVFVQERVGVYLLYVMASVALVLDAEGVFAVMAAAARFSFLHFSHGE